MLAACLIVAVSGLIDTKRPTTLWKENKVALGLYLFYMGLMLTLGAAEGLMASVVVFYAARLLGFAPSEDGAPLKRPAIFEKLMSAATFWKNKCDDDGECAAEYLTEEFDKLDALSPDADSN